MAASIASLQSKAPEKGFDLIHPFHTSWYNDLITQEGHVAKGTLEPISCPKSSNCNAILIGNTKHVWNIFLDWLVAKVIDGPKQERMSHLQDILNHNPFDTFVNENLSKVLQECIETFHKDDLASYEIYWSNGKHEIVNLSEANLSTSKTSTDEYHCFAEQKDSFLVSMQRVAKVTGEYWHDEEGTKLCVHPIYGTWTALRAVLVLHPRKVNHDDDLANESSIPSLPTPCPCPVPKQDIETAKEVMQHALQMSTGGNSYVDTDDQNVKELCTMLHDRKSSGSDWSKVSPSMRPWIKLRDCISIGRDDYRYCDEQLLYHYTKDSDILVNLLKPLVL